MSALGRLAPPRRADALDGLLSRAVLARNGGSRTVQGEAGKVDLPPLTLMDYMHGAFDEMARRDAKRQEILASRRQEREDALRLEAEEQRRREDEEHAHREDQERALQQADERARKEEQERASHEAQEREREALEGVTRQKRNLLVETLAEVRDALDRIDGLLAANTQTKGRVSLIKEAKGLRTRFDAIAKSVAAKSGRGAGPSEHTLDDALKLIASKRDVRGKIRYEGLSFEVQALGVQVEESLPSGFKSGASTSVQVPPHAPNASENQLLTWVESASKAQSTNNIIACLRDAFGHNGSSSGGGTGLQFGAQTVFHMSRGASYGHDGCTLFFTTDGAQPTIVGVAHHVSDPSSTAKYRLDWKHPQWVPVKPKFASNNVIDLKL